MIRSGIAMTLVAVLSAGAAQSGDLPLPVTDDMFPTVSRAEAELGRLLFWDPVLSGNRNISCGTCHHPRFGTGDGVSLGIGEGGIGLGPERRADPANPPEEHIPRNAPGLFNLGAQSFISMFYDGRVETDTSRPSGLRTPMEDDMLSGFSGVLSAQTMFPVLSQDEMAGHYSENDVALAVRRGTITGEGGAWDILSRRVGDLQEYARRFADVYPGIAAGREIGFTDISNAIAAFVAFEWRSDSAPFDAVLRGTATLDPAAQVGADLFYGEAGCSVCHAGPFLTDHDFHAMGVPQFGPGKAARFENHHRDEGRMEVTGRPEDAYRFRTPSLRNVTLTAPYGHTGAFPTLTQFLRHHNSPVDFAEDIIGKVEPAQISNVGYDLVPGHDNDTRMAVLSAVTVRPVNLGPDGITALEAFLGTLEDPAMASGRLGIPQSVPSGLPVDR